MSNKTGMSSLGWSRKINRLIRQIHPEIVRVAKESSDIILTETVKNVSGPGIRPGITDSPAIGKMPVPRRTGDLARSIKRKTIYSWLYAVFSDPKIAPHGKYVHNGTKRMKPRRFLWGAIQKNYRKIHTKMNNDLLKKIRFIGRV